jgi:hypothetical protein
MFAEDIYNVSSTLITSRKVLIYDNDVSTLIELLIYVCNKQLSNLTNSGIQNSPKFPDGAPDSV